MPKSTSNIEWDFITDTIKNEKCILFLGPEIFKNEVGQSLEEQMAEYLKVAENPDIQHFYPQDGLFLFTSGTKKTKSYYKIKKFYQQEFPQATEILRKIAHIPFHLIVSITPDHRCEAIFREEGFEVDAHYYWKKQVAEAKVKTPTASKPIVYNMLGSVERQETMVLTHDDLYDYFESIFQEQSMPEKIKLSIKNADNLIFLGIDFEKWYMQLLLRILYLHLDKYEFMRYAANQTVSDEMKTFCFQQFKMEFIPKKMNVFLNELHTHCQKENLVRIKGEKQNSPIEQWRKMIAYNKIKQVFEQVEDFLEKLGEKGEELLDELAKMSNRYNRLQRKIRNNVIGHEQAEVSQAQITESLFSLLNEAASLE